MGKKGMNVQSQNTAFQDEIEIYPTPDNSITTIAFPQRRVRIGQPASAWMMALKERFNEIGSLPVGWDGYTGKPVSFTTANFAAQIIERLYSKDVPAPSIVPGADGSMQIEWHINGYDVELDVLGPVNVVAYRYDHLTENEDELELESDFTRIEEWISDLAVERNFQAQNPA